MIISSNGRADFNEMSSKEWIVTNGIGGYASSSVVGANTRRYHGLLVAALNPPTDRNVLVSKMEEAILFNRGSVVSLSSNQYPGVVHPNGWQYFKFFQRRPFPAMKFEANDCHLLKTVFMVYGSNTTVVEYENTGENPYFLRMTPFLVAKDYHSMFHESPAFDFRIQPKNSHYGVYPRSGQQPLFFRFTRGSWTDSRAWYRNYEYVREQERGLDYREDTFATGYVDALLQPGEKTYWVFSTDEDAMKADPELLKLSEIMRMEHLSKNDHGDAFIRDLLLVADQFVVRRDSTNSFSVIAGYHWFTDWGRDTMIAMRGLTIATGKQAESESILRTFLQHLDGGMLPNRFPDRTGEALEYNTIDATLWLFVVLFEYHRQFNDLVFIQEVFDHLTDILDHHIAGTHYHIQTNEDGFLQGGAGTAQLTWMDARVGDYVVTPRHGCPVEIQALWYNALRIYQHFAELLDKPYAVYSEVADRCARHFKAKFMHPDGYLYDLLEMKDGTWVADASFRPNQLYAVSLPFSLLKPAEEKKLVELVGERLLTPYGLRTLSTDHPDFKPVYEGDQWHRDTAYHQGTVWPFLMGEYIEAYTKVNKKSEKTRSHIVALLEPLKQHFYKSEGIFCISEVFDGLSPQTGKGTIQQAWSVSAVLKALLDLKTN